MTYETVKLDKSMFKNPQGFTGCLEALDPSGRYAGTELEGLDAYERQLKRFDIRVKGARSSPIEKFFATGDSGALFPEYVTRAVTRGCRYNGILEEIVASRTDIAGLDYRSIVTDLGDTDYSVPIGEGEAIPQTTISLSGDLVKLKKRGRLLRASYEAIKFQRVDVFSVALEQIGCYIAKAQLEDAVGVLLGGTTPPEAIAAAGEKLAYSDLLTLWRDFEDFEMNLLLAAPDMAMEILMVEELRDPVSGMNFQNTGGVVTPMGAKLLKTAAVPAGKVIAMDRRFALEMVTAGGVQVEYDKLMDCQLERAAVTAIAGFNKIFPGAVKVLELDSK